MGIAAGGVTYTTCSDRRSASSVDEDPDTCTKLGASAASTTSAVPSVTAVAAARLAARSAGETAGVRRRMSL